MGSLVSCLFVIFSPWVGTIILFTSNILSAYILNLEDLFSGLWTAVWIWSSHKRILSLWKQYRTDLANLTLAKLHLKSVKVTIAGLGPQFISIHDFVQKIMMSLFNIYGIVCSWFHFTLSCIVPILSYLINIHISFKFTSFSSLLPATVNATTPTPPTVTTNMPDTNRNDKPNNGKKSCVTFFLVLCLEQIYCILRCVFYTIIMSRVMSHFWSHVHWNKSGLISLHHVRMV